MENKKLFQSSKLYDGYSTCFRQWNAKGTHCQFLHGYAISFRVWYEGELDERNWVVDFGALKRSSYDVTVNHLGETIQIPLKDYFNWLLDHTTIIAVDDPYLKDFFELNEKGIIQLRILPKVGCEIFASHIHEVLSQWVTQAFNGKVTVKKVEVYEHYKNAASYGSN